MANPGRGNKRPRDPTRTEATPNSKKISFPNIFLDQDSEIIPQNDQQLSDRKMRGASEACRAAGIMFIPIVFESLGGVHQKTEAEVRKLASALASRSAVLDRRRKRPAAIVSTDCPFF